MERSQDGCFYIHQAKKIHTLLEKYQLMDVKPSHTPMDPDYLKFSGDHGLLPTNDQYRQAVGELLYLSTTTRPGIACAIGILCLRVSKPRQQDWNALKKLLRYLKYNRSLKLKLSGQPGVRLECYVDADWAGDVSDRKSTSGHFVQLGGSPVSCYTRKQVSVAL
ncbi:uncharacterized protein LOC135382966 [Ornithodoros turicata]|uniref:uncharacterized protein LOC135382966 n=1 Tax=Ornithodoros turicata TaxID=34597 RepID=UPI003139A63A